MINYIVIFSALEISPLKILKKPLQKCCMSVKPTPLNYTLLDLLKITDIVTQSSQGERSKLFSSQVAPIQLVCQIIVIRMRMSRSLHQGWLAAGEGYGYGCE